MVYTVKNKIPGYIILLDFQKAFDSIEWPFLIKSLKHFNFGPDFISWIKIIYHDISSCVGNNGYYSKYFKLTRGIRQGCPISALLFLLVAEVIAIYIRCNKDINGIRINGKEFKIKMLADDTTLISECMQDIKQAIHDFDCFSKISGLKLNLEKTEIIPIGTNSLKEPKITCTLKQIRMTKGPFKTLGIWFSNDKNETVDLNFKLRLDKMKTLLNIWNSRNLSLKGRITILKSLILPQILFLFNLIYVPVYILDQINEMFFKFLWRNKAPKIRKDTIVAPIELGGLKMVDVYSMHTAAKISWIKRLCTNEDTDWKLLFYKMLSLEKNMLNKKVSLSQIVKNDMSSFHKQVLESWYNFYGTDPNSTEEILNEYILYNKNITIAKKSISLNQFPNKFGYNIKVRHILDQNCKILNKDILNLSLDTKLTQLSYNSIISAIPKEWRQKIKEIGTRPENRSSDEIQIKVDNELVPVSNITSKKIYNELIRFRSKPPTSLISWIELYPFLEKYNWNDTFVLPYKVIKETYMQSFQYKVLNRVINCNFNLFKWGIKNSPNCAYCENIDTVTHHFFECADCIEFWKKVEQWLFEKLKVKFNLTVCEVIFGIPFSNDSLMQIINYVIILAKYFINKQRHNGKKLTFHSFIYTLKENVKIYISLVTVRLNGESETTLLQYYESLMSD